MAGTYRRKSTSRRFRRMLLRRILLFVFLLILGCGVWYVSRLPMFTITTVSVIGGETIHMDEIEQKAQALLDGTYFFLIPRRFVYVYPHDALEEMVQSIPRVARATVERTSAHEVEISLEEYVPHALWCGTSTETESSDCVFVTEEGHAYDRAPSLSGSRFIRYVTEGRVPEANAPFTSVEFLRGSEEFSSALLGEYDMDVYAIVETAEGDVKYRLRGGGEIVTTRTADIQQTFENLNSILTSEEFHHLRPGNFTYIDLRFGNKVFVKQLPDEEESVDDSQPEETE